MNAHKSLLRFALISLLSAASAFSQQADPGTETLVQVLENMKRYHDDGRIERREAEARPLVNQAEDGRVRHLAAAAGHAFQPARIAPGQPEETARMFLADTHAMLGITTPNADFIPFRTLEAKSRTSVRLQQRYRGTPVVDAQTIVQMNPFLGVVYLVSDVAVEINALDADPAWIVPVLTPKDVGTLVAAELKNGPAADDYTNTPPELAIFVPSVVDERGDMRLVWQTEVSSEAAAEINARWLVDAKSGEILRRYPLTHSALNRRVRDYDNTVTVLHTLRTEGEGTTGIEEVDNCYNFLGDTYEFYWDFFDRDSYDHDGATLIGRVRKCINSAPCPGWRGAQWIPASSTLRFGDGFAVDDVVAHEFTHAVINNTSDLNYWNTSGAINESLADIFGEFVDWSNTAGNDSANVRWLIGEDLPPPPGGSVSALRSMSFPGTFGHPGRKGSALYVDPINDLDELDQDNDWGGVHTNSSVNNKLCYLLTDGDNFNGWTVDGMGMSKVVRLYYHANAQLLPKGANWDDLFYALRQSAVYWEWSQDEQLNLLAACRAVEIGSPEDVYVSNSASCFWPNGAPACGWFGGPYPTVAEGVDQAFPGDRLFIYGGSYDVSFTFNKRTVIRSVDGTAVIGN